MDTPPVVQLVLAGSNTYPRALAADIVEYALLGSTARIAAPLGRPSLAREVLGTMPQGRPPATCAPSGAAPAQPPSCSLFYS